MAFKDIIYKFRTDMNISQEKFAEEFNVSRQTIQKWESGACYPETSKMIEIAKRFDISLDSLILGRDLHQPEDIKAEK